LFYTANFFEFYVAVKEAAKRRIDGAETLYKELEIFFRKKELKRESRRKKDSNSKEIFDTVIFTII
jgi:hypothetical protein